MTGSDKPVMAPEDFRLFQEFATELIGLVLDAGKESYLALKLLPRLEELRLASFADYYGYLKFAPRCGEERRQFISLITNNETYFFREEAQLRVLSEEILPRLKERKVARRARKLHIVSAGCSSGEEVYTLAMLLLESGSFIWDWDVVITGVDVDPRVLGRARAGIYPQRSFQTTPARFIERYFRPCEDGFAIKEVLRRSTRFVEGNLLQFDGAVDGPPVDIIFCRNVLIYFSDETIKQITDSFGRVLVPEGYLFLGHSESLSRITARYAPLRFPGAIVYRKRE
ncbi:MAG TPA: protein-glutamate O-methyltransferase CheR [Geobacteraceae bacterium]